jgi:hypothetical protein
MSRGDHWRMAVHGWRRKPQHWNCWHPRQKSPFALVGIEHKPADLEISGIG